jgi:hypothetical protein
MGVEVIVSVWILRERAKITGHFGENIGDRLRRESYPDDGEKDRVWP